MHVRMCSAVPCGPRRDGLAPPLLPAVSPLGLVLLLAAYLHPVGSFIEAWIKEKFSGAGSEQAPVAMLDASGLPIRLRQKSPLASFVLHPPKNYNASSSA